MAGRTKITIEVFISRLSDKQLERALLEINCGECEGSPIGTIHDKYNVPWNDIDLYIYKEVANRWLLIR